MEKRRHRERQRIPKMYADHALINNTKWVQSEHQEQFDWYVISKIKIKTLKLQLRRNNMHSEVVNFPLFNN